MNFLLPGIGAGLVSALLTAVIVKATPLAAVLYLLSPIPVLIVSLGWNHRSGLVATLTGGLVLAVIGNPLLGITFALVTALPSWWISYLALLGRSVGDGTMEWYPIGRLLGWIAISAVLSFIAVVLLSTRGDFGSFNQAVLKSAQQAVATIDTWRTQNGGQPTSDEDMRDIAQAMVSLMPFLAGATYTLTFSFYIYLAGRIVLASGRLARPWPDLPALTIPLGSGVSAIIGGAAMMVLSTDSFFGFLLYCVMGAAFVAFALQGLAAIHDRTRGRSGRGLLLTGLYLVILLGQGIAVVALSLFGLADSIFGLRRRFRGKGRGPHVPPTPST